MATRRCLRLLPRRLFSHSPQTPQSLIRTLTLTLNPPPQPPSSTPQPFPFPSLRLPSPRRHFATRYSGDEDDGEDEEEWGEEEEEDDDDGVVVARRRTACGKTEEEKVSEATEIGYRVLGSLGPSEDPFKPYEPVFAVVQLGSHQFKVSNGDAIFTERLKYCDVNDKLILHQVLMLGSQTQTIIGRPILPDAAVHAIVEEHKQHILETPAIIPGALTPPPSDDSTMKYLFGMIYRTCGKSDHIQEETKKKLSPNKGPSSGID